MLQMMNLMEMLILMMVIDGDHDDDDDDESCPALMHFNTCGNVRDKPSILADYLHTICTRRSHHGNARGRVDIGVITAAAWERLG